MKLLSTSRFLGLEHRVSITSDIGLASHMENLIITDGGYLKKRPDMVPTCRASQVIDGIWSGNLAGEDMLIAAFGGSLWRVVEESGTFTLIGSVGPGQCMMFLLDGFLYVKTDVYYGRFDGSSMSPVEGYVPLAAVSCTPDGAGTPLEPLNMLTSLRRQKFSCDGTSTQYKLAVEDVNFLEYAKLDGEDINGFTLDGASGTVTFDSPPPEGLNNLEICYSSGLPMRDRVMKCKKMMFFGGNSDTRVFLYGNRVLPNYRFFSGLAAGISSAEYFPVTNYTVIGTDEITSMIQQYDRQLIFCKNEAYYSYCELKQDVNGDVFSSFPVFNLNGAKGCTVSADGCLLNNTPVTLCNDGINLWESTAVENEKNAVCISDAVNDTLNTLIRLNGQEAVRMFVLRHTGELFFVCGGYALVYNSKNRCWYLFSNFSCQYQCQHKNILYLTEGTVIYTYDTSKEPFFEEMNRVWQSCPIVADAYREGLTAVSMWADVEINGPVDLTFSVSDANGDDARSASFSFPYTQSGLHKRLSMRIGSRRILPAKIKVTSFGTGYCIIKGLAIKLKSTERKNKHGLC